MIVILKISRYGTEKVFYIDTDKVEEALKAQHVPGCSTDSIHYSRTELETILYKIEHNYTDSSMEGSSVKYSLYDTEWEYDLVKADKEKVDNTRYGDIIFMYKVIED